MKYQRIILSLALCCLPYLYSMAQSVEECQRMAEANYPLIKRYDILRQTEQFTLSNIQKGWLPQISASAQATYQSDVVSLPDALKQMMQQMGAEVKGLTKDQYRIAVDVNQTIYDGGAMKAKANVTKAQTSVQQAQNDVELYALRDRVNQLYFSILLVDDKLLLNQEMQTLLQANEDKLTAMLKGGIAMECDRDALRAERLSARQQATLLTTQRETLLRVLSLLCGCSDGKLIEPVCPAVDAVGESSANARPELAYFAQRKRLLDSQEAALKTALMPRLSVFAQGFVGYPGYNMYEDMFSHKWSLNGMIGARLTWNIGALYTHKNDRQKLSMQRQEIDTAYDTFLLNQQLQHAQEEGNISAYQKMMAEDDEIISLRSGVRKAAESKLSHGIVDIASLVKEITAENQARLNKSSHEIEMLSHMFKLRYVQ